MTPAVHGGCESLSGTTFPECFEDYMDLRSLQNSCRGPTGASGRFNTRRDLRKAKSHADPHPFAGRSSSGNQRNAIAQRPADNNEPKTTP